MLFFSKYSGAREIQQINPPINSQETEQILFNACQLLAFRGISKAAQLLCTLSGVIYPTTNSFGDEFFVFQVPVPLNYYDELRTVIESRKDSGLTEDQKELKKTLGDIEDSIREVAPFYIRFITFELKAQEVFNGWREEFATSVILGTANQAVFTFKNIPKILHEGLYFRSKTEIKIYNELVNRGLLVIPLCVTVLGAHNNYKEPDFIVCKDGKWGILEVNGSFHTPLTSAEEFERRRKFTSLGVRVYEIFDAKRCYNETARVVDEFIAELGR
jgi:hypothetical protein